MLLGCIGDDFTGSSDLANMLAKGGMRVTQYNGIPDTPAEPHVEAGVVALKSRTIPAADAVDQSLAALRWLRAQGCRQYLFKYCSTFDSTPEGNIGPVLDALSEALDAPRAVVCPAFPATGRSVYQGHLFVFDRLLSESGMEAHPLTPMTDPDIRRWLARQSRLPVGHVAYGDIVEGADAIAAALDRETAAGARHIVTDAVTDGDLMETGRALRGDALLSGGSGIALGLPRNFREDGLLREGGQDWSGAAGTVAALCGSCSKASREQIAVHARDHPAMEAAARDILSGSLAAEDAAAWILDHRAEDTVPLVYSSADPQEVARAQEEYGREHTAAAIEAFFARTATLLAGAGLRRLIVAGGETSGAVVSGLAIPAFEIGPEIDPGVPALKVAGGDLAMALKSGNFGAPDFFAKAARILAGQSQGGQS
ncbi:four-carbon acid sugar kinase family protein [Kaustia mangrovi]|uniref:3-oxo-tetronate kinase n=1 Tax=Kaustia mangrovi TaxID=2593653 RepID=A0A7S8C124_9HYPH|nr:3-oxo-tetronate kinase [Kaustia mangrovi]QPC41410.1 four-carbon acid sugar kinase family protein [Kaustia mangrovi]